MFFPKNAHKMRLSVNIKFFWWKNSSNKDYHIYPKYSLMKSRDDKKKKKKKKTTTTTKKKKKKKKKQFQL